MMAPGKTPICGMVTVPLPTGSARNIVLSIQSKGKLVSLRLESLLLARLIMQILSARVLSGGWSQLSDGLGGKGDG